MTNIIKKQYSNNEECAVIIAEMTISYTYNTVRVELPLRLSTVLFYEKDKWKIVHWHGSTPVETEEGDTWHADEWKKENGPSWRRRTDLSICNGWSCSRGIKSRAN